MNASSLPRHDDYSVAPSSIGAGSVFVGTIEASFSDLFDLFGAPLRVDDGVVSNEWRFAGAAGAFSVYDSVPGSETVDGDSIFRIAAPSHAAGQKFSVWLADKVYARRLTWDAKFVA